MEQLLQYTTVCACENTVVMVKQSKQRTSMKNEFGDCTNLQGTQEQGRDGGCKARETCWVVSAHVALVGIE